jgi:hypothetical protein
MAIECDQIVQVGNELISAFDGCKVPKNSDLVKLVELVLAVNNCSNGGDQYNTLISDIYNTPGEVIYQPYMLHSFSLNVMEGSIIYEGFEFPKGSTRNVEYTTTNKKEIKFTVNTGSSVLFEYLVEDVI